MPEGPKTQQVVVDQLIHQTAWGHEGRIYQLRVSSQVSVFGNFGYLNHLNHPSKSHGLPWNIISPYGSLGCASESYMV
jgi:hypothetical protein